MPKVDCKYWDKCYQKNAAHLSEYNHPPKRTKYDNIVENNNNNYLKDEDTKRRNSKDQRNTEETKDDHKLQVSNDDDNDLQEERKDQIEDQKKSSSQTDISSDFERYKQFIEEKFLIKMPNDFFAFWNFLEEMIHQSKDANRPMSIVKYLEKTFQLCLVGPFDVLSGRFPNQMETKSLSEEDYLRHWRFYYDPPEFQTIFVRLNTGIHYGYWRDTPNQDPETTDPSGFLLARNDSQKNCEFEFIAGNVFEAFLYYLEKDFPSTPFNVANVRKYKKSVETFLQKDENKVYLEQQNLQTLRKKRDRDILVKTFHRAGIVVPFDNKTDVGYRPLIVSNAELKKILQLLEKKVKKNANSKQDDHQHEKDGAEEEEKRNTTVPSIVLEKLQPIITAATIAMDECDFGTSLELGLNLFASGYPELHGLIERILTQAYTVLNRPDFVKILKTHLKYRTKSLQQLSVLQ